MHQNSATIRIQANRTPPSLFAAFSLMLIYAMAFMSVTYAPVWVPAIAARYTIPLVHVGVVVSLELGAVALSSMLTATLLDTRHLRWPVMLGLIISISANLIAAVSATFAAFAMARVIVGFANGFLVADVNRRAAQTEVPSRIFAGQLFVMAVLAAIFFATAPHMIAAWGAGGPFFYCASAGVVSLIAVFWLPVTACPLTTEPANVTFRVTFPGALMLGAPTLIFITLNGVWPYISAAAPGAGVGLAGFSTLLAIGAVLNLAAPMISGWLANGRISPALAITLGVCAIAATVVFLTAAKNAMLFGTGVLFLPFSVMFVIPFYLDLLVRLDKSGKCVAASAAFIAVGFAIGPAAGGLIMEHAGLAGLAIGGGVAMLLTLLATWFVLMHRLKVAPSLD